MNGQLCQLAFGTGADGRPVNKPVTSRTMARRERGIHRPRSNGVHSIAEALAPSYGRAAQANTGCSGILETCR
jgi:hypothetical protein